VTNVVQQLRWALASLIIVAMPLAAVQAQDGGKQPVMVASIAPINKILNDVFYITEVAGQADAGRMMAMMSAPFTQGLDKARPVGVVVYTDGESYVPIAFLPVSDFDSVMLLVKEQFGEPQDLGDGVKLLPTPIPVFVKSDGKWAFVSNDKDQLTNLPADPEALLGTLPKDYDLGAKVHAGRFPEAHKQMFMDNVKLGIESSMSQGPDQTDEEYEETRKKVQAQVAELERVFKEVDELVVGWNVDAESQSTYFDLSYSVLADSELSKQLAKNTNLTTDFGGLIKPDAAVQLRTTQKTIPEDVERLKTQMEGVREEAVRQLKAESDLNAEQLKSAELVIDLMIDNLIETVRAGTIDGAGMLDFVNGKMTILLGLKVADGKRMEDALKEIVVLMKDEPDFPGVQWDADSHQGVRFHTMAIPMTDAPPNAEEVLGDDPKVIMGVGERSFYLSVGFDASQRLKDAIDKSATAASVDSIMEMSFAFSPFLSFIQEISPDQDAALDAMVQAVSGGKDLINAKAIIEGNTVKVRFLLEEGIIKAIGAANAAKNAEAAEADFPEDGQFNDF